jgi:cobalt-zinc-cadmium efflux system protein
VSVTDIEATDMKPTYIGVIDVTHETHEIRRRAVLIALGANAAFLVVEVVAGFVFDSLALLADGIHMVSDVFALAIALAALALARRPPTDRHTYGFGRTEVIAAQVNGVLLLAAAGAIAIEALRRLDDPHSLDAAGVLVVGVLGLAVNAGSAFGLARAAHGNLNLRAALWHLVADAMGSAAVILSACGVLLFDADWLDPVASLLIAVLVVVSAWRILRDATVVLLEAAPAGLDAAAVRASLEEADGVEAVHHVHVWSLGSEQAALSAHVVLRGPLSLHDAQVRAGELKADLADRFGIVHSTLEVECHACLDDETHAHH